MTPPKSAADLLTLAYAHSYDLPIGITRCGNIYGGGDLNWDRIVPATIRSSAALGAPRHPKRRDSAARLPLRR